MNKKRVAIITPARFPGTAGDTANYTEIMNQMVEEELEVILFCPKNSDSDTEYKTPLGISIIRVPHSPPRLQQIKSRFSLRHYLSAFFFILVESFTVLHVLKRQDIKCVFMRHSLLTMQLPILLKLIGVKSIADGEIISDYFKGIGFNPTLVSLLESYEKRVIRYYTYFKVSSKSQAENLQKLGFPIERIVIIPVSINTERIPKFRLEEIPEHTFGYFGVLERWQGIEILLQAFRLLVKKLPTAKLFLIGDGSMREELEKTVQDNNLTTNVIVVGSVPREILWNDYFNRFRIVVIPRPMHNNSFDFILPIKLIEALAAGKPTIAMNIPVFKEIPNDPILLVESPDPQMLADAMEKLSTSEELLKRHSTAALAAVVDYDIRINMKKFVSLVTGG